MARSTAVIATLLFVVGVTCGPVEVPEPATDLVPPAASASDFYNDVPTPASELLPPPEGEVREKIVPATLFLINVYALKNNSTDDESNDVLLHDDVMKEVPDEIAEPLAMFLLVVQEMDENEPVSLDEVAKDLEEEGFVIEKIEKDGETRIVKVDLGSVETMIKGSEPKIEPAERTGNSIQRSDEEEDGKLETSGKMSKIRRKRHLCLKCKLDELHSKHKTYGGGCNTCGGGGGYYQPAPVQTVYQPVQVVPVQVRPQPVYQHPPQQTCNVCGGGGYGHGGHGGGGSSYAQASASASANAYGK